MLALLALVLFPVAAHAECSTSSCVTYEVEEAPTIAHESTKPKKNQNSAGHDNSSNNAKAEGSGAHVGAGESSGEPGAEEPESEETHHSSGGATSGGGNNPPKGGGGGEGAKSKNSGGAKSNEGVANGKPVATQTAGHSSGGSSSPVVPILIAVAVLAAISIGVVLYRQRKSGAGTDGSVSSPNAS